MSSFGRWVFDLHAVLSRDEYCESKSTNRNNRYSVKSGKFFSCQSLTDTFVVRLSLEIIDPHQERWRGDPLIGRWRDRPTRRLEECLGDAIATLKVGAAVARHQRTKEAEEARIRQEAEERRRNQERQRRLLEKVTIFLMEKAENHTKLAKLENLVAHLSSQGSAIMSDEQSDLNRAIKFVLSNMRNALTAEWISEEITKRRLLEADSWW